MSYPTTARTAYTASNSDTLGNAAGVGVAQVLDDHDNDLTALTQKVGIDNDTNASTHEHKIATNTSNIATNTSNITTLQNKFPVTMSEISSEAWTSYTPTWNVSGGGSASIGNGTLTGKYTKIGRTIIGRIQWVKGSTTTYSGSGFWFFPAPVTPSTSSYVRSVGTFYMVTAGNGFQAIGWTLLAGSTDPNAPNGLLVAIQANSSNPANINSNLSSATAAWATGDNFNFSFMYEAAS